MMDFERKYRTLAKAFRELSDLTLEISGELEQNLKLRNCANCRHREVCVEVARRKEERANDYTPCRHWGMEDGK